MSDLENPGATVKNTENDMAPGTRWGAWAVIEPGICYDRNRVICWCVVCGSDRFKYSLLKSRLRAGGYVNGCLECRFKRRCLRAKSGRGA